MISCVAIDDEPLALVVLQDYISKTPNLDLKRSFTDAFAAMEFLKKQTVSLMFLDIQMPQVTGIQMMKSLPKPPLTIFTTAYSNYALDGFNLDAVDFLLKPFAYDRFLKSVNKAAEYIDYRDKSVGIESADFIFVRADYQIVKINLDDIQFIEGMDDYVKIFTGGKMVVTNIPMKDIYRRLPASRFVRVHRSFIVPLNHIETVRNKRVKIGDKYIPVGDSYADSFYKILGENG